MVTLVSSRSLLILICYILFSGSSSLTYADAGVSIEAGNNLVNSIKPACKRTEIPGCVGDIGLFGSVFDMKLTEFKDPLMVSGTDGVGTKLLVSYCY